jgi:mRNA-degrading endonuclease toxin of MazEF toxin-antitoxin module
MFQKGDILVVSFPFTNLANVKRRPALVISNHKVNSTGDYLMVQITSKFYKDRYSIEMQKSDFINQIDLPLKSYIRAHKIFLLNKELIFRRLTAVNKDFQQKCFQKIVEFIE